jgi:molybdopterin converting factor small subunit
MKYTKIQNKYYEIDKEININDKIKELQKKLITIKKEENEEIEKHRQMINNKKQQLQQQINELKGLK